MTGRKGRLVRSKSSKSVLYEPRNASGVAAGASVASADCWCCWAQRACAACLDSTHQAPPPCEKLCRRRLHPTPTPTFPASPTNPSIHAYIQMHAKPLKYSAPQNHCMHTRARLSAAAQAPAWS